MQVKNILSEQDLQLNDPPALAWVTVRDAVGLLWIENPKLHDLGGVIESIKKHGLQELPKFDAMLPNVGGEEGAIKAGNGRIEALAAMERDKEELPRGMGLTKDGLWVLPVLVGVDAKSRALAESYAIDSNNLTLGGGDFTAFDMAKLWKQDEYIKLLERLALEDGEYPASVDADSLDLLIKNLVQSEGGGEDTEPQLDRAEELREKWGVEPGMMFGLGEHRIICGDCTDPAVVARVMGGEKADACVTDPPYGVGVNYVSFDDTEQNVKNLIDKFLPIALEFKPVALTPGVPMMWHYPKPDWVGDWLHPAATSSGPWGFVSSNPILFYGKDPYLAQGKGRRACSVSMVSDRNGKNDHPVSKPLKVWEWLIERMTPNENDTIYEPFSGSGTTIIACENLKRRCRAIEISPAYVGVSLQRFLDHTGIEPVLLPPAEA